MSKRLVEYEDTELLAELIRRHEPKPGPYKVSWSETPLALVIPIGKDNTASLYLHEDDLKVMEKLNAEREGREQARNTG